MGDEADPQPSSLNERTAAATRGVEGGTVGGGGCSWGSVKVILALCVCSVTQL